jgi:hypothetical protein
VEGSRVLRVERRSRAVGERRSDERTRFFAKSDDDAGLQRGMREARLKKNGRSGGGIRIALGAAGKSL